MLSLIKTWQCYIGPHAVHLQHGAQKVLLRDRPANEALDVTLTQLLSARPAAMNWLDAIEFCIDTPALDYLVIPWQDGITTPQELFGLAHLTVDETLLASDRAKPWQMRFEDLRWGQPALIACLQASCWQQLAAVARQQRLRFQGVVTPFQFLLHPFRRKLPEEGLFVSIGPTQSRILCRQAGQWRNVLTLALPQQDVTTQLQVISRLTGMSGSPRYVMTTRPWRLWKDGEQPA